LDKHHVYLVEDPAGFCGVILSNVFPSVRLFTKFSVDLIPNLPYGCPLCMHSRRYLRLINTDLSLGCVGADVTTQQVLVIKIRSASAVAIEPIEHLRYFTSNLIRSPDPPPESLWR
jgi:hypothetical protein